jgi:hypothetical protein
VAFGLEPGDGGEHAPDNQEHDAERDEDAVYGHGRSIAITHYAASNYAVGVTRIRFVLRVALLPNERLADTEREELEHSEREALNLLREVMNLYSSL